MQRTGSNLSTEIEIEISDLLLQGETPRKIAIDLLTQIHHKKYTYKDRNCILSFALNNNCTKELLSCMEDWVNKSRKFPWKHLAHILSVSKSKVSDDFISAIIEGATQQERVYDLAFTPNLGPKHDQIKQARIDLFNYVKERFDNRIIQLKDKLEFLKQQRLIEEQKEVLKELIRLEPKNESYKRQLEEFKYYWSRDVLKKYLNKESENLFTESHFIDPEEKKISDSLLKEFIAINKPNLAYDFAIALHLMDASDAALTMIENSPEKDKYLNLKAELLFKSERYLDCLSILDLLQEQLKGSEDIFSVIYLKALVYEKLGRKNEAISYLQDLVNVKGEFRSSASLLREWMTDL